MSTQNIKPNFNDLDNPKALIQQANKTISLRKSINTDSVIDFCRSWKEDFTNEMRTVSKSKKRNWSYYDAVSCTTFINDPLDKLMIEYLRYINSDPLKHNDFYKYVVSYQNGEKLDDRFFKHDKKKLFEYYKKVDEDKKKVRFNKKSWEAYVLFMMLKLSGLYSDSYDKMFNVKIDDNENREYNPLTGQPSVLRGVLPFNIIEYDISQAFPSFIFIELDIEPFDVYDKLGGERKEAKKRFNMLLNCHNETPKVNIEKVRKELRPIYGDRVNEVITDERFNNKGKTFKDFTRYEKEYIEKFIEANNIENYVRLHDGVIILENTEIKHTSFDKVNFIKGQFAPPEIKNDLIPFHDDKNETSPSRYAQYFKQEGFIRLLIDDKDEISIIKNENKIVRKFNWKTETISFLKSNIVSLSKEGLKNHISKDEREIKSGFLLMESEPLELQKDTKDTVYLPFKNGVAKITKDNVKLIPYDNKDIKFFTENEIQKHELDYENFKGQNSNFFKFIVFAVIGRDNIHDEPLTAIEEHNIQAFLSMIGYLVSNYKDPAKTHAIVISDEGANGTDRKGGRGKSMPFEALKRVRPLKWAQGDSFDTGYKHKFADVEMEHDILFLDDTPASFNYNSFYGEITGSLRIERKGTAGEEIPFKYSPKFAFSTNYNFRYNENDSSTIRRFYEYKLKPFFNLENKVNEYFNQTFFEDWTSDEWKEFYSFIIDCARIYLENGLMRVEYDKSQDNYMAYFHNEVIEQEMERILNELLPLGEFTTSKFLEEYKSGRLYSERLFNDKNVKKYIEVFSRYRTDFKVSRKSKKSRIWIICS